jgi:hypothetical protein
VISPLGYEQQDEDSGCSQEVTRPDRSAGAIAKSFQYGQRDQTYTQATHGEHDEVKRPVEECALKWHLGSSVSL